MVAVAIVVLCGMLALVAQKLNLNGLIKEYNLRIKAAFNKLVNNAGDYSKYMSAIASHSRGVSYLALSTSKKFSYSEEHYLRYKHINAINVLLSKLKEWSKIYRLDVDFTSKRPETRLNIDIHQPPFESDLYAVYSKELYPVAVNNSGMDMMLPFDFVVGVEIHREELYDDRCD